MSKEEYKPFVGGSEKEEPQQAPIYHDKSSTPMMRWIIGGFLGLVCLLLVVSVIMIIVKTATDNPLFALLLVSLLAFAQLEFFLVFFVYKGKMPRKYFWTIFLVGVFVIIECICTDIVVFSNFEKNK